MPAFCKAGVEQRAWWARCRPVPGVTTSTCHGILKASNLCFLQDRSMLLGCLPRPAAQTRDVGIHVAVAGSELSECILRSTVATRVHGIAKKDGRGV